MASAVVRRVNQKLAKGPHFSISDCRTIVHRIRCQKSGSCTNLCCYSKLGGYRMMSTSESRMSPWLMLPPVSDEGGVVYRYYSVAEKKVLSFINKRMAETLSESPTDDDAEFVGSSHGWIALFKRRLNYVFLSNPLTGRHIKLPSISTLPDPEMNAIRGRSNVSKVILSSSPDDPGCRALMTFGPANRLAYCSPAECVDPKNRNRNRNRHRWTPIGDLYLHADMVDEDTTADCAHVLEDLVYCDKRKVFATITPCEYELHSFKDLDAKLTNRTRLEDWDTDRSRSTKDSLARNMIDSHSFNDIDTQIAGNRTLLDAWYIDGPVNQNIINVKEKDKGTTLSWVKKNKGVLQHQCVQIPHIVYAEESDQLYMALRFVMLLKPDGTTPVDRVPFCRFRGLAGDYFPSKTVGFVLLKLNRAGPAEIVDHLDGLAMFVGINHSIALPASNFPELKPDSIYFTDSKRIKRIYGGNDIGVFDYRNKTVAEVVSSDQIGIPGPGPDTPHSAPGLAMSSPMWFDPAGSSYDSYQISFLP